jgi:predicted TIM-barrel fold metal-dependent hydrolase
VRVVDIHAHIFPDKIAQKASDAIGEFYGIPMKFDGTVSTLLDLNERFGVDASVVHSVATVPQQVAAINDFIAETAGRHPGRLIGFATIHPGFDGIGREIDRVISLGLRGVKIHPDFQKFCLDDEDAFPIYEAIEGRLPILVHTGDQRYEYSKARRMANVIRRFPRLQAICAHFGGYSEWTESAAILQGCGVQVDTSSSMFALSPGEVRRLIDGFGVDNVLFGTDYPMWGPENELKWLGRVELTPAEREKILHGNAERLFGF